MKIAPLVPSMRGIEGSNLVKLRSMRMNVERQRNGLPVVERNAKTMKIIRIFDNPRHRGKTFSLSTAVPIVSCSS